MRVLISCLPGHGHLYPFIPLAQALQRAGHEVAVVTSASWQRPLAELGIPLLAAGPDWRESDFDFDTARPGSGNGAIRFGSFLVEQVVPPMLDEVRHHVGEWQPDMMLGNDFEPVGRTVAELAGIPFVLATHGARLGQRMRRRALANLSAACRSLCGLPEVSELEYPLRWRHLGSAGPGAPAQEDRQTVPARIARQSGVWRKLRARAAAIASAARSGAGGIAAGKDSARSCAGLVARAPLFTVFRLAAD